VRLRGTRRSRRRLREHHTHRGAPQPNQRELQAAAQRLASVGSDGWSCVGARCSLANDARLQRLLRENVLERARVLNVG
jgi:hypothetical protein